MSKVLMVDDDPMVQSDNKQYFESMGYEVVCAENTADAEKIISTAALDCIVLELRVRGRIKSGRAAEPPNPLHFEHLSINPANRTVTYENASADFSTYEFDVLYLLARHPRQVFTYEQIYDQIWCAPVNKGVKSLQMIIVRIRQKLLDLCPEHEYIQTIRRKGYLFVP